MHLEKLPRTRAPEKLGIRQGLKKNILGNINLTNKNFVDDFELTITTRMTTFISSKKIMD